MVMMKNRNGILRGSMEVQKKRIRCVGNPDESQSQSVSQDERTRSLGNQKRKHPQRTPALTRRGTFFTCIILYMQCWTHVKAGHIFAGKETVALLSTIHLRRVQSVVHVWLCMWLRRIYTHGSISVGGGSGGCLSIPVICHNWARRLCGNLWWWWCGGGDALLLKKQKGVDT